MNATIWVNLKIIPEGGKKKSQTKQEGMLHGYFHIKFYGMQTNQQ